MFTSRYQQARYPHPDRPRRRQLFADEATLDELEAEGRVVFRYVDKAGNATAEANPNGA